jgi:hypothetical protein
MGLELDVLFDMFILAQDLGLMRGLGARRAVVCSVRRLNREDISFVIYASDRSPCDFPRPARNIPALRPSHSSLDQ